MGEGSLRLAQVQAFLHPLYSILFITTGKELIAMAAPDPWPPIGSLVAMGYGAISRPPLRGMCVKGVPNAKVHYVLAGPGAHACGW